MPVEGIEPVMQLSNLLGDLVGQQLDAAGRGLLRPLHGGADDGVAPEVEGGGEIAGIGQRELPMPPGPALVAADGGAWRPPAQWPRVVAAP